MSEINLIDRVYLLDKMVKDINLEMKSHNHSMIEFSNALNKLYQRVDSLEYTNSDINECTVQSMTEMAWGLIHKLEAFITAINS